GIWIIIFLAFRISSLASLCGALAAPISFFLTGYKLPICIASVCWCILVFITHRANIKRLIRKEEKKLSEKT
ncbi:MAG: glycerol-3-phosphate acyltransferase, partial [Actinomycetota bacterium]|nr:glycerol-3-phosphate acyltransferase [Actinomycetota bacterium]